eukprot:jgi/Mesen1/4720/ME000241S03759
MDTDGDGGTEAHARSLVHFDNPSQADELEIEQQAGNAAAEANESYFTSLLTSLGPGTAAYDPTAGPRDHSALASPPISPHPPSAPLLATPPTSGASGLVLSKAAPSTVMARKTNAPSEPRLREILSDPLTGHYLEDAMVGRCGHSFGSATLRRVRETGSCTVCGGAVDAMTLVPNLALRAAVAAFRREETSLAALPPPVKTVKRRREMAMATGMGKGMGMGMGILTHPPLVLLSESPVQSMFAPSDVASDGHHGLDESAHQRGVQFPFAVGDHVLIRGNKRTPERFVGRLALITTQCLNGWYLVQTMDVPQEEVRLQYRSLEKLPPSSSSSAGQRRETRGIPGVAGDDAGRDDDLILPGTMLPPLSLLCCFQKACCGAYYAHLYVPRLRSYSPSEWASWRAVQLQRPAPACCACRSGALTNPARASPCMPQLSPAKLPTLVTPVKPSVKPALPCCLRQRMLFTKGYARGALLRITNLPAKGFVGDIARIKLPTHRTRTDCLKGGLECACIAQFVRAKPRGAAELPGLLTPQQPPCQVLASRCRPSLTTRSPPLM